MLFWGISDGNLEEVPEFNCIITQQTKDPVYLCRNQENHCQLGPVYSKINNYEIMNTTPITFEMQNYTENLAKSSFQEKETGSQLFCLSLNNVIRLIS